MFNEIYETLGIQADIETEKAKFIKRIEISLNELERNCYDFVSGQNFVRTAVETEASFLLGQDFYGTFVTHLSKTDFNWSIIVCKAYQDALIKTCKEYPDLKRINDEFDLRIIQAFNQSRLDIGIGYDKSQFYKKGVHELDKALLLEPLIWLNPCPIAKKYFSEALNDFLKKDYPDAITKCYSAVESIVKTISESDKSLDHLIPDLLRRLELPEHWKAILVNYCKYAHEYASRHGKKESGMAVVVTPKDVEAYLYLTGLIIRLVIQSKNKSN